MRSYIAAIAALTSSAGLACAQSLYLEKFDNGVPPSGWTVVNKSLPLPVGLVPAWDLGVSALIIAQGSTNTSPDQANYAYTDYSAGSTQNTSVVSAWLITQPLTVENGNAFTFWTTTYDTIFGQQNVADDRLQVRMSPSGASTNVGAGPNDVGDFTVLLADINPTYQFRGYPVTWTKYVLPISGLSGPTQVSFAFRYYLTNNAINGSSVGVDTVELLASTPCYANCDGNTTAPLLSASDFTCFLTKFRAGDAYANCDGNTTAPLLSASDFTCFLNKFRAGCP